MENGIFYVGNIIERLKEKGYNTNQIRMNKLLSESTMQALREGRPVSLGNIGKLCGLLDCQPGDLLEYIPDDDQEQKSE